MHQNAVQLACDDQYEMLAADFGVNAPLILCLQPLSLHYALLCTMQSVEHKRCADPHNPRRRTGCPASSRFNATTKKKLRSAAVFFITGPPSQRSQSDCQSASGRAST